MNSKEQKIKEAYGDCWDSFNLTSKKCALNNNGWISQILDHAPDNELDLEFQNQTFRPKSLQGIENNNGWISLSEKGLPKDDSFYFVIIDGFISIKQFHIIQYKWWKEYVSHYQPIEKPKSPLY